MPARWRRTENADPGRYELLFEWAREGGEVLSRAPLAGGGSLEVLKYEASMSEALPSDVHPDATQEWRVLRFVPAVGSSDLVQTVCKVCVAPEDAEEPRVRMRGDCLTLAYTRSMVAALLATLAVLGISGLRTNAATTPLRVLCIGLGGGTVPRFLTHMLPNCHVDVAELEEAVVTAATGPLGLPTDSRLRVSVADGVALARREAAAAEAAGGAYDAVVVDAYDAAGNVPEPLRCADGGLVQALREGLLRERGLVITNFLPDTDVSVPLAAYREGLAKRGAGFGFTVRAGGSGNLLAVQTCGGPQMDCSDTLRRKLWEAADQVGDAIGCPFDLPELAVRGVGTYHLNLKS